MIDSLWRHEMSFGVGQRHTAAKHLAESASQAVVNDWWLVAS